MLNSRDLGYLYALLTLSAEHCSSTSYRYSEKIVNDLVAQFPQVFSTYTGQGAERGNASRWLTLARLAGWIETRSGDAYREIAENVAVLILDKTWKPDVILMGGIEYRILIAAALVDKARDGDIGVVLKVVRVLADNNELLLACRLAADYVAVDRKRESTHAWMDLCLTHIVGDAIAGEVCMKLTTQVRSRFDEQHAAFVEHLKRTRGLESIYEHAPESPVVRAGELTSHGQRELERLGGVLCE